MTVDDRANIVLKESVWIVETEAGALVIDESTFITSEVNVSGYIILRHCVEGAVLDKIVAAFAHDADCSVADARAAVESFLAAARAEGWLRVSGDASSDETSGAGHG